MIDFRKIGFSSQAVDYPRDQLALEMFAAFNGVRVEKLPIEFRYFPNASTRGAWNRVAEAAYRFVQRERDSIAAEVETAE